ncbi:MAG: kynureninase, partial [Acidimicrobiales bacterium]
DQMAAIVGGLSDEVVVMNSLTINLHLLMVSFYTPTPERHKILIEEHAFPSDHFAVESQIRMRGFDPETSLVTVGPRPGSHTLDPGDILAAIAEHGPELALVLLPGVQYYTGQVLAMADITRAGHGVGAKVGFDLAHAVGNIQLDLHDQGVDFAAWCTYKYLNSGPGGVGGAFVHNRHIADPSLQKLLGWWGTNKETRFEMETVFEPIPTVESWQVSNGPALLFATLRASLDVIDEAGGIGAMRQKSILQIEYLDYLLDNVIGGLVENITPRAIDERGCQFALRVTTPDVDGRAVFTQLEEADVACDWRYPDVIRIAPVPLYNSFDDIYRFIQILDRLL